MTECEVRNKQENGPQKEITAKQTSKAGPGPTQKESRSKELVRNGAEEEEHVDAEELPTVPRQNALKGEAQ